MSSEQNNFKGHAALLVLGGSGTRFGQPKQLFRLPTGDTIGARSVRPFIDNPDFKRIVIVVRAEDRAHFEQELRADLDGQRVVLTNGGKSRSGSVWNGLLSLEDLPLKDMFIWVHDGARPGIDSHHIMRFMTEVESSGSLIPVMPITDTVKRIQNGIVQNTENREELFRAQTPQIFKGGHLFESYYAARNSSWEGTDEASYVEKFTDILVHVVKGESVLEKITHTEDLSNPVFSHLMRKSPALRKTGHTLNNQSATNFRIGFGSDVHALVVGRPLIMGGIEIPFEKGLKGHSDADVITHTLIDAIFGASGLGDIGKHFPDTSDEYKDVNSIELLKKAYSLAKSAGYQLSNVDMTVTAERPKLAPYIPKMRQVLSEIVELAHDEFNIKAKTAEGMGPEGRGESISCRAVVLMTGIEV